MAAADTVSQLNEARKLGLKDPRLFSKIVPGVLPLIGPGANIELRRWGSDFLSETFASPVLPNDEKTALAIKALPTIKGYLEAHNEDTWVVKTAVQAAASCFPLVFRYIIDHPNEAPHWQVMAAIKSNILRRMDVAPPGVRICCIKFVQRVVQAQTPGLIADPRRPEQNEISLALVPRDHPVIPPPNLEAEASGLLDRLLSLLQENSSDALLVTATLNCLGGLIRTRASIANKILNAILQFNPLKLANSPITSKSKVLIRSMERTTKALLLSVIKKNPNHVLAGRIQQYLERLHHSREEIFSEVNRKRAHPTEPEDASAAKRQRVTVPAQPIWPPPLPPGPVTIANVFTLTEDPGIRNFDVQTVTDINIVVGCVVPMLQMASQERIEKASNAVRARWLALTDPNAPTALNAPQANRMAVDEDDDDYEPDYPTEDAEQISNRLDQDASAVDALPPGVALGLGPFRVPTPQQLTHGDITEWEKATVARIFSKMTSSVPDKKQHSGFNRLAAEKHDRDAWITILARLATRATAGLQVDGAVKKEVNGANGALWRKNQVHNVADGIRELLRDYVIQDWRRRIDVAISWLNEEWYNDRILQMAYEEELAASGGSGSDDDHFAPSTTTTTDDDDRPVEPPQHYERCLLRMLDGFLPYLDVKDKVLIRFLSEVPEVSRAVLDRVRRLADDPERVPLAVASLQYLVMLKPPAREAAIDTLEDLWRNNPDAKTSAAKVLAKWRPLVLQEQSNGAGAGGQEVKAEMKIEPKT